MKTKEVDYVILKPSLFIGDCLEQGWTDAEFGCYCKLVFLLYMKGGSLQFSMENFAYVCHAGSVQEFEQKWKSISPKFRIVKGKLKHKKVTTEIRKAKKRIQVQKEKGLKGAKARWHKQCRGHSTSNATPMPTKTKTKTKLKEENKENICAQELFFLPPDRNTWNDISFTIGLTDEEASVAYDNFGANGWKRSNGIQLETWEQVRHALKYWRNNKHKFESKNYGSGTKQTPEDRGSNKPFVR